MPDPTIIEVEGTIEAKTVTGTIEPVAVSININEFGWYNDLFIYTNFEQAGIAGYQITDFPDMPMDAALVVYKIESEYYDPNGYGEWET